MAKGKETNDQFVCMDDVMIVGIAKRETLLRGTSSERTMLVYILKGHAT